MREDSVVEVNPIGGEEHSIEQHDEELNNAEASVKELSAKLEQMNQKKHRVRKELHELREKVRVEDADTTVQKLIPVLKSLKALERQESEFQASFNAKQAALEAVVIDLEKKLATGCDDDALSDLLNDSLSESLDHLNSAKKNLAAVSREIISLKRQLDDVPCQSELIQYERRFSELNFYIQEKLRQTRKYYATYNALLEAKELMLKETSLLNSIHSQFQEAITSPAGRMKLIDSMEGIMRSSQQKLEKVQTGLQEEQKVCEALKEKYAASITEQRRCDSLLKSLQEECAENERLKSRTSALNCS